MQRNLLTLILLASIVAAPAPGADIRTLEVNDQDGQYTVKFDVLLNRSHKSIYTAIAEPDRWPRLSDVVTAAKILGPLPDGRQRVSVTFRDCILIFCHTVHKHEALMRSPEGDIETLAFPEQSDFSYAHEHWRITDEGRRTRILYQAEVTPSFYIPPVIGPYIFKAKIRSLLLNVADNLEKLTEP